MKYDVTIGIPVYKSVGYIQRSLTSALNQTYSSIEFLVIDDGGADGSMDIVERMKVEQHRGVDIRIIRHEHNKGVAASRNRIIDEASGDYLYFMDSDDVIAENAIELMMQQVRQFDAEIVFGSYEKIEINGDRTRYQYPAIQLFGEDELAAFAYRKYAGIQASACNYLVKTSLLREHHHRFINTDYWEDLVFTFDLVTIVRRAVMLSEITYHYICREGSLSNYQRRSTISKEEIVRNAHTVDYLKETSSLLYNKVYYPQRCYNIVMTDFYIASNVLKHRKSIVPFISNREIRQMMTYPATFCQICSFRTARLSNLLLFLLGKLPSSLCVLGIWCIAKMKKLIHV
jgi:glycosyltransferase involved in cell wall biosynthesis